MRRTEIRVVGFGGQGVVLSGYIMGRAHAVHAGQHATMIQSFGPEARGSACSATLVLQDSEVLYPYIERPDVLIVMSGEGYDKYKDDLKDEGILIYESNLVRPTLKEGQPSFGVPSTRIAEELGRVIVQNIVMLGFAAAASKMVPLGPMREAVKASVPPGTEDLNLRAFDAGVEHYEKEYGEEKQLAAVARAAD